MTDTQFWYGIVSLGVMAAVAIVVPLITFKYNKQLKEFEFSKLISQKALEVMAESYHRVHVINRSLGPHGDLDPSARNDLHKSIDDARIYWERNLFYLPENIRKEIIPLTNLASTSISSTQSEEVFFDKALDKIVDMFGNIETAFAEIMKRYNVIDRVL